MEYKREISRASLRQISETFTVLFMSYRLANVPVFFGKKSTFYDIFGKNHDSPFENWELCLSTWP